MVEEQLPAIRRRESAALARALVATPAILPAAVTIGIFALWTAFQGGYPATVWYPGALLILACLATAVLVSGRSVPAPRVVVVAVASLGGFTAWSLLSILWADVRGDAWDGANRTLLYLTIYALFALWPWRTRAAALAMGAMSLAPALVIGIFVVRALAAEDPDRYFIGGRFSEPAGYANANCALALMAFFPALFLASRRETPWPLRGILLAAAGFLLEVAVLTESRGSLFAFPLVVILYLLLVPGRMRSLLALVPVGAATAAAGRALLDVYPARSSPAALAHALGHAGQAIGLSALALAICGAAIGLADRRISLSAAASRTAARTTAAAGALAAVAVAAVLVAAYGSPISWISDGWHEFSRVQSAPATQSFDASRFSEGLGSNRHDFWRVGVETWLDHPAQGIGADNFAVQYLEQRRSPEEPLYPHSLEVRALAQTGIGGTALLAALLGAALLAALRPHRERSAVARALACASLVAFGYWFVHGSVDWFWEFPGLAGPALAYLGLAASVGRPAPPPVDTTFQHVPRRTALARAASVCLVIAGLAATATYVMPWLAARDVASATVTWRQDAGAAFRQLDRARALNPLSERPDMIAGGIASRLQDWNGMREAFLRAQARNPANWYAELELAIADSQLGRRDEALAALRRAAALNPREPVIGDVATRIRAGERVPPGVVDRVFLQRVQLITS